MKNKTFAGGLVVKQLENVPKEIFTRFYSMITELVGSSPGIYALYDDDLLYYVGKSTDLRKRVKQHLRDRHYANWTHFSLYLVRRAEHIGEMEGLMVRIANPKGNRVKPRGKLSISMLNQLKEMIKEKQKDEFNDWFGKRMTVEKVFSKREFTHKGTLKGLVSKKTKLFRTFKGNDYQAILLPSGIISFKNKNYVSPTGAALAVIGKNAAVNGWRFWYIKKDGDFVKLGDYKASTSGTNKF